MGTNTTCQHSGLQCWKASLLRSIPLPMPAVTQWEPPSRMPAQAVCRKPLALWEPLVYGGFVKVQLYADGRANHRSCRETFAGPRWFFQKGHHFPILAPCPAPRGTPVAAQTSWRCRTQLISINSRGEGPTGSVPQASTQSITYIQPCQLPTLFPDSTTSHQKLTWAALALRSHQRDWEL